MKVFRREDLNETWHSDVYDKLTPYWLSIHSCVND